MSETDGNTAKAARDGEAPLLFDAVLAPHRSLGPRGFLILMSAVCAFAFAAGLGFYLVGAWPVVGFLGLDVLLIYGAFRLNYRHGRMYESLTLTPRALTVARTNYWGETETWRFQPYWLRVSMDDPPRHDSQLSLTSHGKKLVIGAFLTPDERLEVARALRAALADCGTADHPGTA
jgi:uncharacterized membrane protein